MLIALGTGPCIHIHALYVRLVCMSDMFAVHIGLVYMPVCMSHIAKGTGPCIYIRHIHTGIHTRHTYKAYISDIHIRRTYKAAVYPGPCVKRCSV